MPSRREEPRLCQPCETGPFPGRVLSLTADTAVAPSTGLPCRAPVSGSRVAHQQVVDPPGQRRRVLDARALGDDGLVVEQPGAVLDTVLAVLLEQPEHRLDHG